MLILCATDLLPKSEAAINRAALLAHQLNAALSLVHVVAPIDAEGTLEDAQRAIRRLRSRSRPPLWGQGPPPSVVVRIGDPHCHVIRVADQFDANLVVVGPHRSRGASDRVGERFVQRLLSARRSPVLVVQGAGKPVYENVLLALDLSPVSAGAVRAAEALVLQAQSSATVVHAFESPYGAMPAHRSLKSQAMMAYDYGWEQEAEHGLRDLLRTHSNDFTRYQIVFRRERPDAAILETLSAVKPDLFVMGTRGYGVIRRTLFGSLAEEMLKVARCDLLIVPSGSLSPNMPRRLSLPAHQSVA